jgi:diguanylate cyclase (GGDEF)-like protein
MERDETHNVFETWKTVPKQHVLVNTSREAYVVQIYPTGPGMGSRHALGDKPTIIGRGESCDIRLEENSVSRQHARIQPGTDGYYAVDLGSTNGTFVNDTPASMTKMKDGDYLRVGNCIYRFLASGNVEARYHEEIYRLMIIDALTEIPNKRFLLEFLDRELARSLRYKRPLSVVMFDLDKFKSINDQYGHLAGDFTLRELAATLKSGIRRDELFARYGGEEFAIVLPEATRDGAMVLAERLRAKVEKHTFQFEGKPYPVTISLGVATTVGQEPTTPTDLIRQADEKLYQAKREGRNRVVA